MLAMMAKVGNCVGRENSENPDLNLLVYNEIILVASTITQLLAMLATSLKFTMWIQYQKGKNTLIHHLLQFNQAYSQHRQQKLQEHLHHWKLAIYVLDIAANRSANLSLQAPTQEEPCQSFQ